MQPLPDLMLVCDEDAASIAVLRSVADRLRCELVEAAGPAQLTEILAVRRPTIAAVAVDCPEADGLRLLQVLAERGGRPVILLMGAVDARVLASARRVAEAQGLSVIGTCNRPLNETDIERLLLAHASTSPPIQRDELTTALLEHQFVLHFQPKIAIDPERGMTIQGVEALVRWQHPQHGKLLPRHFLPAVEQHDLHADLTDFVVTDAVRQAGSWRARGIPLQVDVNLNPRLVKDRAFPDRLAALLCENEMPAAQIVLDIKDSVGIRDRDLMLDVFTRLRILGVGLSLDNFGTGLWSLSELYKMPFSEVKVDRGMLKDVTRDREAELIVRAMVDLAHRLNLTVCAAGVESVQTLEFVRSAGFDTAQGRLFCGPVPANEIESLALKWPHSAPAATGAWRAIRASGVDADAATVIQALGSIASATAEIQ